MLGFVIVSGLCGICRGFVAPIELYQDFFIRSEGLFPAFEFVAGFLRFCFVGELENHVGVSHVRSLRCDERQVKNGCSRVLWASYKRAIYLDGAADEWVDYHGE